jgi:hypothetical protein
MLNYSQNNSYNEQEYYQGKILSRVTEFLEEVEDNPTKYSCELFRPYVISLGDTIAKHFSRVQQEAEPEELKTEFIISDYPHHGSKIECQVRVSNEEGKSTASSIKIKVKDSPTNEYTPQKESITVSEYIEGGKSVSRSIPIVVSETDQKSRFTIYYELHYKTRTGREIKKEYSEAISLYSVKNFQEISNPYDVGGPVKDENMFFGRDKFIKDLISSIHNSAGKKSFVLYGQKRTGKSSILYYLQKRLELPIIPVRFSIQGSDVSLPKNSDMYLANFLYKIASEINKAFSEIERKFPSISTKPKPPTLEELQKNSDVSFEKYMYDLQQSTRKIDEYKDAKIILLIDEFSYIYGQIKREYIPETFMQYWKALLEKGYFGTVLVGQDYMPRFIDSFANEFQIAKTYIVSYLEKEYARQLIVKPILTKEGKSRYEEGAVNRIIELTAGSPFYIQILCEHLVEYMNRRKVNYVTEADIEKVKGDLISGNNSLERAKFDNLTAAGDDNTDNISKDDAEAVLRDIANGSPSQSWCPRSAITSHTKSSIGDVLEDLVTRKVIEKNVKFGFRIRVGLFKEWLLENQ